MVSKYVDPGDMCIPGKPLLTIEGGSVYKFQTTVREALSGSVKRGEKVQVYIDAIGRQIEGSIKEIVYSMDPASRDFIVKIELPRVKGLLAGMYGKAFIPIGWKEAILISKKALQRVGQVHFVYCKEDGKTVIRYVKPGKEYGDDVEILTGLDDKDIVIIKE